MFDKANNNRCVSGNISKNVGSVGRKIFLIVIFLFVENRAKMFIVA